jgi:hypothetical protein
VASMLSTFQLFYASIQYPWLSHLLQRSPIKAQRIIRQAFDANINIMKSRTVTGNLKRYYL